MDLLLYDRDLCHERANDINFFKVEYNKKMGFKIRPRCVSKYYKS